MSWSLLYKMEANLIVAPTVTFVIIYCTAALFFLKVPERAHNP